MSSYERQVHTILKSLQLPHLVEAELSILPGRRYDFITSYNNEVVVIEVDGEQHFTTAWKDIAETQAIDVAKTKAVMESGYRMIRLKYDYVLQLPSLLNSSDQLVCVPNAAYQWLLEVV